MVKEQNEALQAAWGEDLVDLPLPNGWSLPVHVSMPPSTKSLWNSMWSTRSRGGIPMDNLSFGRFSSDLHFQNRPAPIGGILDSSGLAAIFAGLEFAGLLHLQHFAGKSPGYATGHPTSIHRRGMGPTSSVIHPQDLPLVPSLPLNRCKEKWSLNCIDG